MSNNVSMLMSNKVSMPMSNKVSVLMSTNVSEPAQVGSTGPTPVQGAGLLSCSKTECLLMFKCLLIIKNIPRLPKGLLGGLQVWGQRPWLRPFYLSDGENLWDLLSPSPTHSPVSSSRKGGCRSPRGGGPGAAAGPMARSPCPVLQTPAGPGVTSSHQWHLRERLSQHSPWHWAFTVALFAAAQRGHRHASRQRSGETSVPCPCHGTRLGHDRSGGWGPTSRMPC